MFPKGWNNTKKEEQRYSDSGEASSSSFSFNDSGSSLFGESLTAPIKKIGKALFSPLKKSKQKTGKGAEDCRDQAMQNFEDLTDDMKILMLCKELEIDIE
jgi:hypothetical protein